MSPRLRGAAGAVLPATVTVIALLAVWWFVTADARVPEYVLPAPGRVVESLVSTWPSRLGPAFAVTAAETLLGLAAGLALALVVVVVAGLVPLVERALSPLLVASQAIPVIVIGPLLTIALGYGIASKIVVVALLCFFPVALNLLSGVRSVGPATIGTMRTLHASRAALFWRVRLPHAIPRGFAGLRISVTFAPVAAVFAEYSGATDGIGFLMLQAIPRMQTPFVFAQVVVLTAMSAVLFGATVLAERLACPWAREGSTT